MSDATSEWQTERLDLAGYLDRVGVDGELPADFRTLARLHRAHVRTIPFENLDPALGRGVDLDVEALQAKLVHSRRGGYCFEHNLLFAAVLERLGYHVTRLSGRVMLDQQTVLARTHVGLRVRARDGEYLADVGFGSSGLTEPLPWADGAEAVQDGWRFRLYRRPSGWWSPARLAPDGWQPMYRLGPDAPHLIDFVVGNYYVGTHPRSPFTGRLFVGRQTDEGRLTLNDTELVTLRADGSSDVTTVAPDRLGDLLASTFGIEVTADHLAELRALLAAKDQPPAA